jgi:ribosome biogenesis protein ERB1
MKKSASISKKATFENDTVPEVDPANSENDEEESVYDSEDGLHDNYDEDSGDDSDDSFEVQGSSSDEDDRLENQNDELESDDEIELKYENEHINNSLIGKRRGIGNKTDDETTVATAEWVHTDDLSSDDEDEVGVGNRIGRVPLHWYDEYEHIGYDSHGTKISKSSSTNGDLLDRSLAMQENMAKGKFVVYDALNDKDIELSARQIELIRRVQAGAYAHPEHDGNPEGSDYFSGVDKEISGLNSNQYERKATFQPSKWEKLQVERLLERLEKGDVNMDYLTGKVRDMNDVRKREGSDKPFALWKGDEEDLLNTRKGPQHIAAPKMPPPGHAASYRPPDEYLPTDEEVAEWKELPASQRPHGHMVPKQFPNLRSVGAYQHSVREAFERCLDLYLAPRLLKRRLNIDPESLVPRLPKANDLKPFPTIKCIEYETPYDGESAPIIRSVTASPDGQYMASGASDGFVRLWEVQSGRLLRSWNLFALAKELGGSEGDEEGDATKPVVSVEWNPNRSHHCILAAISKYVFVVATGTAGNNDSEVTSALLHAASKGGNLSNPAAAKSVSWNVISRKLDIPICADDNAIGPVCALAMAREVAYLKWHGKGDYFVTVSPKAGSAAVLIHQLSKGNSQQPFKKAKGESQLACFHPSKPFLFVASQTHVRIYHLVKQAMVKRLVTGCRWISSIDVHPSGDHLVIGSLDRRVIWFDLDLSSTPYKTLKYHERAVRACTYHRRYPLMASSSDDGSIHVFHGMVYNDLMKNPLIVPVKILNGHSITSKLGVLTIAFHPTQPWIFSGGADGKILLYQDI